MIKIFSAIAIRFFQVSVISVFIPLGALAQVEGEKIFKITIAYTEGGGGHKAAMSALENALQEYPDRPKNVRLNFRKIDPPMSSCAGKLATAYWDKCFSESHYDLLEPGLALKDAVENHVLPAVGAIDHFFKFPALRQLSQTDILPYEPLVMKYGRPDLLVSVINSGNSALLAVSKKHKIPFRIICTDYKIDSFIDGLGYYGNSYSRDELEVYIPLDAPEVIQQLEQRNIPYQVTGYPVNPVFNRLALKLRHSDEESREKVRKLLERYGVDPGDSVILVMMGAKGFDINATLQYILAIRNHSEELHFADQKLHLFLASGQNEALREFGNQLSSNEKLGFQLHSLENLNQEQVALFMGIHELGNPYLFFTKPGGSTVGQAEAMGTPTLYSLNPIEHETYNANWMQRKNYASTIQMLQRSKTLHPQKLIEVCQNAVHSPVLNLTGLFPPALLNPFTGPLETIKEVSLKSLPPEILNQDLIHEQEFINKLKRYLIGGQSFDRPPLNEFSNKVALTIYRDLISYSQ